MYRLLITALTIAYLTLPRAGAADKEQEKPKEAPPAVAALFKLSAEDFIKRFDKNGDGMLDKDEMPPFMARGFDKFDGDNNGKLDKKEVEQMLQGLRQRFPAGGDAKAASPAELDKHVDKMLEIMDKNKDGKISKDEAQGKLAEFFDNIDRNKDGALDREELRAAAARALALRGGAGPEGRPGDPGPRVPDFDALDKNADGRLTRDELKGTPYLEQFDAMDTDKDGKLTRKEFEAHFTKRDGDKPPDKGKAKDKK